MEPPEPFRVGLLLTERCNVQCDHCWLSCGPEKTAEMTEGEARGYIDQITDIQSVEWVSFTGGEPFLMPETLRNLISYASEKGLKTECVTNCFWAVSEARAEDTLRGLMDAGLDVLNTSVDDFHQRHIPFSRVRSCYEASKRIGLRMVIMCAASRSGELGGEEVAHLLGDNEIRILGRESSIRNPVALAIETGFLPVGRGEAVPESEWVLGNEPIEGPCRMVLRDVAITPVGELLPCCSGAGIFDNFHLGSVKQEKLFALIYKSWGKEIFRILSKDGPVGLQKSLGSTKQAEYINRCHLCVDIFRHRSDPKKLSC